MTAAPRALLARAVSLALLAFGVLGSTAQALSWIEAGEGALRLAELARLLAPLCAAAGLAGALAVARQRGSWDAWALQGGRPLALLAPSLLLVVALGALELRATPTPSPVAAALEVPSPVDAQARWWPGRDGWERPALEFWQRAPGRLGWSELVARARLEPPRGARARVDAAELTRRAGAAWIWPLGALAGVALGVRGGARGRGGPWLAAAAAALAVAGLRVVVMVAAAALMAL